MLKAKRVAKITAAKIKMRRMVAIFLLGSALLLVAGCGSGGAEAPGDTGGSRGDSESNAPADAAPQGLPTMPAARFAAPTTMITPQSAQTETVSATATVTVTDVTVTEAVTATGEMTETEEVTSTEEVTGTE